jgi:hypothetical protein
MCHKFSFARHTHTHTHRYTHTKKRKGKMDKVLIVETEPAALSRSADTYYVFTSSSNYLTTLQSIPDGSIAEIRTEGIYPSEDLLAELFRLLKAKAKVAINGGMPDRQSGQTLSVDLKIQGFTDIMAAKDPGTGERFIVAQKPDGFDLGASAAVNIPVASNNNSGTVNGWGSSDDSAGLVDENELLNDGIVAPTEYDCGSSDDVAGKRRACKNCSCGLAELEAAEEAKGSAGALPTEPKMKSNCGNCSKGDAFRCASCPFLGKPAFESGTEKLVLSLQDDI